ncbi:UNVERIFIED_CONTAM: hypothetical protein GTU68_048415 [Idotea baltica]|nr:hypothetical protein [Idotea baltica]
MAATTGCGQSPPISARTTGACASVSATPATRNWSPTTCSAISPRWTGTGWSLCWRKSPTTPVCWQRARTVSSPTS